ncbi:MAG: hypothetical protein ABI693_24320 [Bryobacteraceae bacterium]
MPVTLTDFSLLDGSSDGSRLLVSEEDSPGCEGPLWVVPTNGEPARRLNNTCATTGSWSPDGKGLAYVTGLDLYVGKADGTEPRKLATLPAGVNAVTWSPNGERLRFAVSRRDIPSRLWEALSDGSGAHPVLDGWSSGDDQENRGRWTPDGKYYLFNAIHNGVQALWGMRERGSGWDWRNPQPFTLLLSPDGPVDIAFTTDRKKLLVAMSTPLHGELMRYEPGAGKFFNWPDATGLSAGQTSFRSDGQKIAYVSYPDMRLWTMNPDGSDRREIAHYAALPDWSPDGRQIAYMCWDKTDQPTRICTIAADGGVVQHPVPGPAWQGGPSWSPDGKVLFFGDNGPTNPIPPTCKIHQFDVVTGKLTDVPGSQGLWTARVSPTGRYVAAMTVRNEKLVLFDRDRGAWKELASFGSNKLGDNPVWSKDGAYLFIDVPFSSDPAIYRIRVPDGRQEAVVKLTGLDRPTGLIGVWLGLTPDSRPLLTRKVQASEIYAMDWIAP